LKRNNDGNNFWRERKLNDKEKMIEVKELEWIWRIKWNAVSSSASRPSLGEMQDVTTFELERCVPGDEEERGQLVT
jgi:hypothetical protein